MITRKLIYDLHRQKYGELYKHSKHSADILSRVTRIADKYPLPYHIDYTWLLHLIVWINGKRLSVYAGGWSNLIEILPLKNTGSPYSSRYERGFLTPAGAVNYILKKYSKRSTGELHQGAD